MTFQQLHVLACAKQQPTYCDPATGYAVFTARELEKRGRCCGCGCRHCLASERVFRLASTICWQTPDRDKRSTANLAMCFLSGGKDLSALVALAKSERRGPAHHL